LTGINSFCVRGIGASDGVVNTRALGRTNPQKRLIALIWHRSAKTSVWLTMMTDRTLTDRKRASGNEKRGCPRTASPEPDTRPRSVWILRFGR
jgi:hypothetical protein